MRLISGRKVRRISQRIAESGADCAIFLNEDPFIDSNIAYLTGFHGMLDGVLFLDSSGTSLLTTSLDYERALDEAESDRILKMEGSGFVKKFLAKNAPRNSKIGIIKSRFPLSAFERLGMAKSRMIDIETAVGAERSVKEAAEISALRKSASICNGGIRFLEDRLKMGMELRKVSADLERELKSLGSEKAPFDTIVTSGPVSSKIHPYPSAPDGRMKRGLGIIDFGATFSGYATDVTVPIAGGKLSVKERGVLDAAIQAFDSLLPLIKPGVSSKEICSRYVQLIKDKGFPVKHSPGHGIGLDTHDYPSLGDNIIIKENMVLAIETGVYVEGVGGSRMENDILVGKTPQLLTRSKLIRI